MMTTLKRLCTTLAATGYLLVAGALIQQPTTASAATVAHVTTAHAVIKHHLPTWRVVHTGACEASYYGGGGWTASGAHLNSHAYTAASPTLHFGTHVRVIRGSLSVIVVINDRGPYVPGRCLDLSTAAMARLHGLSAGVINVRYQVLTRAH